MPCMNRIRSHIRKYCFRRMQRAPVSVAFRLPSVGLHANTDAKEFHGCRRIKTLFLPLHAWSRVLAGTLRFIQLTKEFSLLYLPPLPPSYETWKLNTVFMICQYWTLSSVSRVTHIFCHHFSSVSVLILYSFCILKRTQVGPTELVSVSVETGSNLKTETESILRNVVS
jgi:hypothetical protein